VKVIPLDANTKKEEVAAAIGFFDGVHKAHQTLIHTMKHQAKKQGLLSAVITFDRHPRSVIQSNDYKYLTPLSRKIKKIESHDIDILYLIRFDKEKAAMHPQDFIEHYLKNVRVLVCGFDFTFGYKASGNKELLQKHPHFKTLVLDKQTYHGDKIGSTPIREAITSGNVDKVPSILGEYFTIEGTVIHGSKKGRSIGYPTANIDTHDYLVPKKGVYATKTHVNGRWHDSVSSIGYNPTLNKQSSLSVESYIFDFDEELYGSNITTIFIKRIRGEIKFDHKEALIQQIKQDVVDASTILKAYRKNRLP
jgi:riboflavin kinase/FMN adenylyltransferase